MHKRDYLPHLDRDIEALMHIDEFLSKLEIIWMVESRFSNCWKLYVNIVNIEEFLVAEVFKCVGWADFLFDLVDEEGDEVIWEMNGFEGD